MLLLYAYYWFKNETKILSLLFSNQQPTNNVLTCNKNLLLHFYSAVSDLLSLRQIKDINERLTLTENEIMGEDIYRLLFVCADDCSVLLAYYPLHTFLCSI